MNTHHGIDIPGLGFVNFKSINAVMGLGTVKLNTKDLRLEGVSTEEAIEILESSPFVEYAEPNVIFKLFTKIHKKIYNIHI